MTTLKEHPIWHNVTQTLEQINPNQIASYHLQACQAQIYEEADYDLPVISCRHLTSQANSY